jgi:hypothetical protein
VLSFCLVAFHLGLLTPVFRLHVLALCRCPLGLGPLM